MTVGKHRKRLGSTEKKLVRRIERLARTAAVLRLRGNIVSASYFDRVIDSLVGEAEVGNFGDAAFKREVKGRQRGGRLYHKVVKTKR
jgi:hypothetical protein